MAPIKKQKKPSRSLLWGLMTILLVSSVSIAAIFLFQRFQDGRANDDRYNIVAVLQCCHQNEGLKTSILVELLQLSIDQPTNLYRFDVDAAKENLFACPIIQSAEIKKINPGTLYIDYSFRKPIAYVVDYSNTAIDDHGVLIPFKPYYTPKNIPGLILGLELDPSQSIWGKELMGAKSKLVFSLLKLFNDHFVYEGCFVRSIDISKAYETSCGQREIVVSIDERAEVLNHRTLRLTAEHYPQQLANYLALRPILNQESTFASNLVIDMRIPKLAFISHVH